MGTTAIPGKEPDFVSNINVTIDYAKALNAKKIHIMAGKIDDISTANWKTYENNLKYAANKLKEENIIGVIEPINQHSVPKYFLSDYGKGNANHFTMYLLLLLKICCVNQCIYINLDFAMKQSRIRSFDPEL